jgi:hypothetical protein
MLGSGSKSVVPLSRPGTGTWAALAMFALVSWWGLYSAAVERTIAPNGFDWFASMVLAGIAVSRWLAGYGTERVTAAPPGKTGTFDSGDAVAVGIALVIPGGSCWLAARAVLAHRRGETNRRTCSALWMVWAVAGTTGQAIFIWTGALTPSVVLFAASLLNVAAIAALMLLEPISDGDVRKRFGAA